MVLVSVCTAVIIASSSVQSVRRVARAGERTRSTHSDGSIELSVTSASTFSNWLGMLFPR